MPRQLLNDEFWPKLKEILLQFGVYDKTNLRLMVEGMFYRMRTGIPWRDLPEKFGQWNSVYKKFSAWSAKGIWHKVFNMLIVEPDLEWVFIDGSYVKAHQHSAGGEADNQSISLSRGGKTSKIHMVVDGFGLPIKFEVTGGHVHDSVVANDIIAQLPADIHFVIADKGYDKESLREEIRKKGATPIIPRKHNSIIGNADIDWCLYKYRHLVENVFARLKHYRAVATRFDKLKRNFESTVSMACSLLWLPM